MAEQEKKTFTAEALNPLDVDALFLAKVIFAEDAVGGPRAWMGVGSVGMNRFKSGKYGKTLQQVLKGMSSAVRNKSVQWQKADKLQFNDYEQRVFNKIKDVSDGIVSGKIPDTVKGATHFENLKRFPMPYWAKEMDAVAKEGQHTYFKEKPQLLREEKKEGKWR
jgi:spore germination cell wall hydrolase CwlJ-like protein